jgi:hypothetical protein
VARIATGYFLAAIRLPQPAAFIPSSAKLHHYPTGRSAYRHRSGWFFGNSEVTIVVAVPVQPARVGVSALASRVGQFFAELEGLLVIGSQVQRVRDRLLCLGKTGFHP